MSVISEELKLHQNRELRFGVTATVDDSNLSDPHAYDHMGKTYRRFNRFVTIRNTGSTPIFGLRITTNNGDLSSFENLKTHLQLSSLKEAAGGGSSGPLSPDVTTSVFKIYNLWKDHVFHASSCLRANDNPYCLLNFWGHGICSETAHALAILLSNLGVNWRRVDLNGHWVFEYYFTGKWNIVDTNQLAFFLHFDNSTLASFEEILRDPLLILRTKAYGKYGDFDICRSWENMRLYEYLNPKFSLGTFIDFDEVTNYKVPDWDLFPNESITFHFDRRPSQKIGKFNNLLWRYRTDFSSGDIEHTIDSSLRRIHAKSNTFVVRCKYPIYKVVNCRTGTIDVIPNNQLMTEYELTTTHDDGMYVFFCHGNKKTFPALVKGENRVCVNCEAKEGTLTLFFDYCRQDRTQLPQVEIANSHYLFEYRRPHFKVKALTAGIEKLWWQISTKADFGWIIPNFDCIEQYTGIIELSAVNNTFINPDHDYFLRVKSFARGIWSEWSKPVRFSVKKPLRPFGLVGQLTKDGTLSLNWDSQYPNDVFYYVFGSNRYDFVPEIYSDIQVEKTRNHLVRKTSANRNLITITNQRQCVIGRDYLFYRVIAKKEECYSVPSDLLNTCHLVEEDNVVSLMPEVFHIRGGSGGETLRNTHYKGQVEPISRHLCNEN